jgi:hypothetical protein
MRRIHGREWTRIESSPETLEKLNSTNVESDSQKKILIGHKGEMLKKIGTEARKELEAILGFNLGLFVKVAPDLARAFEVPLYQLFYEGEEPPKLPNLLKRNSSDEIAWGSTGKDARFLNKLRRVLSKTDEDHRKLVMHMAQKMAIR